MGNFFNLYFLLNFKCLFFILEKFILIGFSPSQIKFHSPRVQLSPAMPAWIPQCDSSKVGAIDSNEENTDEPNSEWKIFSLSMPISGPHVSLTINGIIGSNGINVAFPFGAGNPVPWSI